ncbi:hypothetical protein IscW_ISCW001184 [Ixodes scapularis]|uniref:Uncharacterized protein n=1 Tax=Ixodes scapularis TaxID=6945 RepID=B7P3E3_IXOSC|nr:hypothetical protein IscW_ISCW001184 [Ixodes scapularis]|eukprot:XP_002404002.1 hypothetical protein IscW_ISCW001184 [Ixodes scapularis]
MLRPFTVMENPYVSHVVTPVPFKWTGEKPSPGGTSRTKDDPDFATPKLAAVDVARAATYRPLTEEDATAASTTLRRLRLHAFRVAAIERETTELLDNMNLGTETS